MVLLLSFALFGEITVGLEYCQLPSSAGGEFN